jgi:hypothetical protein
MCWSWSHVNAFILFSAIRLLDLDLDQAVRNAHLYRGAPNTVTATMKAKIITRPIARIPPHIPQKVLEI